MRPGHGFLGSSSKLRKTSAHRVSGLKRIIPSARALPSAAAWLALLTVRYTPGISSCDRPQSLWRDRIQAKTMPAQCRHNMRPPLAIRCIAHLRSSCPNPPRLLLPRKTSASIVFSYALLLSSTYYVMIANGTDGRTGMICNAAYYDGRITNSETE